MADTVATTRPLSGETDARRLGTRIHNLKNLFCAGAVIVNVCAALLAGSTAQASASIEITADPSTVSASSGAGTQVRTSATQGDVRISGTQGESRTAIKAVPGTKASPMPTPNTCNEVLSYTCD